MNNLIDNNIITFDKDSDTITINPVSSSVKGSVRAIASKSHAHRLLIAAALSEEKTNIITPDTSKDIEATIGCLNSLGANIIRENGHISVKPIDTESVTTGNDSYVPADTNESGSTLRFMLPVIGALGISTSITMHGRLSERPLSPLYEELISHGLTLSPQGSNPMNISGKLTSGDYTIAGNVSSQFVTGLLLALPIVKPRNKSNHDSDFSIPVSTLHVTGRLESRPYVDITLDVLKNSGIDVTEKHMANGDTIFYIPSGQTYHLDENVYVDGDWSNAAFFLAAGAINTTDNPITITGLNTDSLQGDKKIITLLKEFGADIVISDDTETKGSTLQNITVSPAPLHGIDIDASDIPDLVPILSVVASTAEGTTTIRNIERLRIKESDRVETVIETLTSLGADIHEENNAILVKGKPVLCGGIIDSYNDHRIAMSAAIASIRCENSVIIKNPRAVDKSYPGFYDDLISILH